MAAKTVTVPINFGRQDKVAPKHAPFGVLASVKNLRHRELGGLGLRNGYQPVDMGTSTADLVAYDLHELNGRLIALGTSTSDGYPTDIWEYTGNATEPWRQSDRSSPRASLPPFTNLRRVASIPHPEGGVTLVDSAAGGGYVCLVYKTSSATACNVLIVKQDDDQVISFERGGNNLGSYTRAIPTFAGGKFFILGVKSDNSIELQSFTPGTSVQWSTFAAVDALSATAVSALDIVPVFNATTALLAVAWDRSTATNLSIKVYQSNGSQLGSTISLASTNTSHISLEADQTANQICLASLDTATLNLRTWNFSGTLLAGPTALTAGSSAQIVRLAFGNGDPLGRVLAVAVNNFTAGVSIAYINPATHSSSTVREIDSARMQTRLLDASSPGAFSHFQLVAFGGLIGPSLASSSNVDATNALFTFGPSVAHVVPRDYLNAKQISVAAGLYLDTTTNRVVWTAGVDDGSELVMPSIALLDFKSQGRRQSAKFGGLLYLSGAPPLVYDGRFACEPGFELPGIISITPSNGAGALTNSATYSYQVHFEFTLSDGSIIEGPPSSILNVTMGASDDTNTVVVQTPHALAVALAGGVYGADVTAVLSRTEWSPSTIDPASGALGAQLSVFRRAKTQAVPTGIPNYGSTLSIVDTISDADLADEGAIYTQSERGALSGTLEHNPPQPCSYLTATEGRILSGGLFHGFEFQLSKEAFLGSVFNWSEFSSFFGQVSGLIRGVYALDSSRLIFTRDEILVFGGSGPDDLGAGAIASPLRIPTIDGLKDWRSLLEVPQGLFLQLDDDKLYQLPRGGGSPQWIGRDIHRELRSFPTITGGCRHRADNAAVFACNNLAETSAKLIVQDLEFGTWLVDEPPLQTSKGISAMVSYGRSVAYVSGGIVYAQSTTGYTDGASTPIIGQLVTRPIYPFGLGGYGEIHDGLISCEFRGACDLQARVSYDDGQTFSGLTTFSLTGSPGESIRRKWALPTTMTSSVVFEFTIVPTGTGTEGIIINQIDLLVSPENGLANLNPAENGSGA